MKLVKQFMLLVTIASLPSYLNEIVGAKKKRGAEREREKIQEDHVNADTDANCN